MTTTQHERSPWLMRPVVSRRDMANAAKHHDQEQLAALASLIAPINASHRLCVITCQPGGGYQPSQFG